MKSSTPDHPRFALRSMAVRPFLFALATGGAILLIFWLSALGSQPVPSRQVSPLETPPPPVSPLPLVVETATPTPLPIATDTPPATFPVEPPPAVSPGLPTSLPVEMEEPIETPSAGGVLPEDTPRETETPLPLLFLPQIDRPIIVPPPTPVPDMTGFILQVISSMAGTAAWIWLTCGSLVFFVVAGIVAGVYISQQHSRRYELYTLVDEEQPPPQTIAATERATDDDGIWPASLP